MAAVALVGLGTATGAQKKGAGPAALPGVQVLRDLEYVQGGHERNRLDLYLPEKAARPLPVILWVHGGGLEAGRQDQRARLPLCHQGLRGGLDELPVQPARDLPGPDSRLQGRRPLAARQRQEVRPGRGPHRRLGRLGWRPSGGVAGHHGGRQGAGGPGRQRGSVQPRAGGGGLVWPDGLPHGGREGHAQQPARRRPATESRRRRGRPAR